VLSQARKRHQFVHRSVNHRLLEAVLFIIRSQGQILVVSNKELRYCLGSDVILGTGRKQA